MPPIAIAASRAQPTPPRRRAARQLPTTALSIAPVSESAHPCGASGYALGFGERMCYAFVARRAEFSAAGQAWLRGVRTCLQRALVPLLPASTLACSALGDAAYASHAGCYTAADNSICDLPFTDVLTLAAVLSRDLLDPRAIRQMGEVAKTCLTVAPAGQTRLSPGTRRCLPSHRRCRDRCGEPAALPAGSEQAAIPLSLGSRRGYCTPKPPSTVWICPTTKRAAGEARYSTASAMSPT